MTNGIWVTSPTRTIVDVAAVVDYDVLEAATFCALRRRLTTGDKIAAALTRSAPMRGRPGGAAIRDLLSDLDVNGSETGSYLETRFWQWIRKTGLPLPRRQFVIRDGGRYIGRVDFAYPAQRFAIEVQSYEFHGTSRSFQEDQARLNDLHDCGWQGRLVTKTDLDDPRQLFDELSRRLGVQSLFVP
jgi:very-short-patch-repair endonuclease